ncbi:S-adenosyl-L-methionine-dependent methyltransferase [Martensiomyces pterosporus]|nr:S-adenosyl-L-methionine-dependent methyltransferase [Martensiomyces pterosporus]
MSSEPMQIREELLRRFIESGERERLQEILRGKLHASGWQDRVKDKCQKIIRESDEDVSKITVDDIAEEPADNSSEPKAGEFEASRLGRKDHWDGVYDHEISNFEETGDIGEVWFGEDSAVKMVDWVCENIGDTNARILDVGCGNGHLLLGLADEGYTNLTGTDYSSQAVELATRIAKSRSLGDKITYRTQDFLSPQEVASVAGDAKFDVVLDKGTYDAICLKPKDGRDASDEEGAHLVDQEAVGMYPQSVVNSLSDRGVFLITSCNWTEQELVARFKPHLEFVDRVKHRSFQFGGVVGQTVVTVAFKKR